MLYVQLDTNWVNNPKVARAGLDGAGLHATTMCLAKSLNTDGWVDLFVLARHGATDDLVDRLVTLGLLDREGDQVRPHDWLDRNPSKLALASQRASKVRAGRAGNHKRHGHPGNLADCSQCEPEEPQTPSVLAPATAVPRSDLAPPDQPSRSESESYPESEAAAPVRAGVPPTGADDRQRRISAACRTLAEERALTRDVGPGWVNACATGIAKDHHQALHRALSNDPAMTDSDLIDLIEGERKPAPMPSAPQPLPVEQVLDTTKPDFAGGLTLIRQIQESRHA